MNQENLQKLIQRYTEAYDTVNNSDNDEIFKWAAVRHFHDTWFAPQAENRPFNELFSDARRQCSVLIDNSYVCPSSGVVKIAERHPDKVKALFREVLLADDQDDIDQRQNNMERFLEEMNRLCSDTFPNSFKFKQDRHAASCYLALIRPEDNFIYRYSEAEEFARHVEFGLDIGSGDSFSLKNYYTLCQLVVDELHQHKDLLEKYYRRLEVDSELYYQDHSLHLLAFDLMYCARNYNFYSNMEYKPKAECVREYRATLIQKQKRQELLQEMLKKQAELHALDIQITPLEEIPLLNIQVHTPQYGVGHIVAQNINQIAVQFATCEKKYILHKRYSQHPRFDDDKEIIAAFTEYESLCAKRTQLQKELQILAQEVEEVDG